MDSKQESASNVSLRSTINPNEFDVSISALLIGLDAEKYIENFRKNNIGQCTLMELTNEDLVKLGVDDSSVRHKLLEEVKNLPVYNDMADNKSSRVNLDPKEVLSVLEESSQHLSRIYLSMITNTLALKRSDIQDVLLDDNIFASKVALATLSRMTETLNTMDIALHTQFKALSRESKHRKKKKALVGILGSAIVAVLGVYFVRSLRNL